MSYIDQMTDLPDLPSIDLHLPLGIDLCVI